jgi:hypothetical protein
MMTSPVAFVSPLFSYRLAWRRLGRTIVTGSIASTAAGRLMFSASPERLRPGGNSGTFPRLTEIGLAWLLLTVASRTGLNALRSPQTLSVRPLGTGLSLTLPSNHQ